MMLPENFSITYDLGHHALEITQDHTLLIATHSSEDASIAELVQLDSDEVYKLFITLKEVFQSGAE